MAIEQFDGALDFNGPTDQQLATQDAALNLPAGTTRKQLTVESNMNPLAVNKDSGAKGLAQIMDSTADHWSQVVGRKLDPFNVDDALLLHKLTMQENIQKFGNTGDALRAYNSGWNKSKWDNSETNNYITKILGVVVPSANAATPDVQPFTGQLDQAVPFTGELDQATPGVEEFNGRLDGTHSFTDSLRETAKSLYQVPLAMGSGLAGGLAGLVGGGATGLAEFAGFAPQGAALDVAKSIEQSMPFLQPDSPVSQAILEGMGQIAPSNLTHMATSAFSQATGLPPAPETFGSHAMDLLTNMFLGGRKAPEALGELIKTGEPLTQTKPEVVPQGPLNGSKSIPDVPATPPATPAEAGGNFFQPQYTIPAREPVGILSKEPPPAPPGVATPEAAASTVADITRTPDISEATKKLDTALRQVESGFVESNYKRVPLAITNQEAAALGYDPMKMLSKQFGAPLSSPEVVQAANFVKAADDNLVGLMHKVVSGEEITQEAFFKAIAVKNTMTDYLEQGAGELGRAMRALQQVPKANQLMDMGIKNMMDNFGDRQMRMQMAQAILNAADDPATLAKTTRALAEPTAHSKINQIIVNSFLSSPLTLKTAIESQATMPFIYLADQAVGAALGLGDRGIAAMLGRPKPDVVTFGEVGANLKGLYHGAKEGFAIAKQAWKTEAPGALPSEKAFGSTNVFGTGPLARLGNTPSRLILTQDQFYKGLAYRMGLNGLAERSAWQSGLTGKARAAKAEQIRNSPTEAEVNSAEAIAKDYTFTRDLGDIANSISKVSNAHPLVKLNLPFIKIGINLGKQLVEHTPMALVSPRFYKDLAGTPAARNAAVAKMMVGTMFLNQMYQLAQDGRLTGSAPKDARQRAAWLALHPEDSFLASDGKWHSHRELGAISTLMSASAELAETWNNYQRDRLLNQTIGGTEDNLLDDTHAQAYWGLANTLYESFINQTWFRTPAVVVDTATSRTPDAMSAGIGRYVAGLMPASPGLGFLTRQIDPILRRTSDSIIDPLRDRLPWESDKLLPRLSMVTGEVLTRNNPLVAVPQSDDLAIKEMVRLGIQIPFVPKQFTLQDGDNTFRPEMTPEEQNYVAAFRGQNAKALVDQLVSQPNWDKLPDQNKRSLITMAYNNFQTVAEQILTSKMAQDNKERLIVEVRRSLLNTSKGQPLLPPQMEIK